MKKVYSIVGLLVILTLLMVGCSSNEPGPKQSEAQQPIESEKETLASEDPIAESEPEIDVVEEMDEEIHSTRLIELMNSKRYTMKMNTIVNMDGKQIAVQTTTVVADGQSSTTMESEGLLLTTILKDNKAFMIMHDQKMIIVTPIPEYIEAEPGLDEIDFNKLEYLGKGKAMFLGNERNYEEYKVDTGIVRYYFEGKELDGMEVISDEATTTMDIQFFDKEVDMSVFELPKDYMKVGQ